MLFQRQIFSRYLKALFPLLFIFLVGSCGVQLITVQDSQSLKEQEPRLSAPIQQDSSASDSDSAGIETDSLVLFEDESVDMIMSTTADSALERTFTDTIPSPDSIPVAHCCKE